MLKMSSISDLKRPTAPKNTEKLKIMMQRTAKKMLPAYVGSVKDRQVASSFAVLCIIIFNFFSCLSKWAEGRAKAGFRVMLKDFEIKKAFSVVVCLFII